jgi:hypothetical protein
MAVVGTANRHVKVYKLDGQPQEVKDIESPLKFQVAKHISYYYYYYFVVVESLYIDIQE